MSDEKKTDGGVDFNKDVYYCPKEQIFTNDENEVKPKGELK